MRNAKEEFISDKCSNIEANLSQNNSKKAYQLVKDLTSSKQRGSTVIQDKKGECLTEESDVLKRWTEYCYYVHQKEDCPEKTDKTSC